MSDVARTPDEDGPDQPVVDEELAAATGGAVGGDGRDSWIERDGAREGIIMQDGVGE